MRTDSHNLSPEFTAATEDYIKDNFGADFVTKGGRVHTKKAKLAQEAHEAIRPTKFSVKDSTIAQDLEKDAAKLYDLIWRRAVGSQMSDALIESTTVFAVTKDKGIHDYRLKTTGSVLVFEGFLKI
jgi:DNA topoisomerase-1